MDQKINTILGIVLRSNVVELAAFLIVIALFFVVIMRALHFYTTKQDPIKAIVPGKLHWFMQKKLEDEISKSYMDKG